MASTYQAMAAKEVTSPCRIWADGACRSAGR